MQTTALARRAVRLLTRWSATETGQPSDDQTWLPTTHPQPWPGVLPARSFPPAPALPHDRPARDQNAPRRKRSETKTLCYENASRRKRSAADSPRTQHPAAPSRTRTQLTEPSVDITLPYLRWEVRGEGRQASRHHLLPTRRPRRCGRRRGRRWRRGRSAARPARHGRPGWVLRGMVTDEAGEGRIERWGFRHAVK